MNVKAVVKVMNFHALLRVEASGQQALKYSTMEEELSDMMRILQNNQNLRLDKRIRLPDEGLPVLRIYLGSDLGFCGSVNTSVSSVLQHDGADTEKIVIGRKLRRPAEVSVFLTQEEGSGVRVVPPGVRRPKRFGAAKTLPQGEFTSPEDFNQQGSHKIHRFCGMRTCHGQCGQ